MQRRPLPDDFAVGSRVLQFICGDSGEVIRGHVADAVAARLNRVHFDGCQVCEDVGHILELGPVELDVLAGREVAVGAVIATRHLSQHAQLVGAQQPVRYGDAQHRRMALDVQSVAQAQGSELVFRELAREETLRLVAKLRNPLIDERLVDTVVPVHPPDYRAAARFL